MICPKCGNMVEDGNTFCPTCGATVQAANNTQNAEGSTQQPPYVYGGNTQQTPPPPQYNAPYNQVPPGGKPINGTLYLVLSIIDIVICCLPLGIASLVYALKIDKLIAVGDYAGAQDAANKSKRWLIISAVAMAVIYIIYFVLIFAGVVSGVGDYY